MTITKKINYQDAWSFLDQLQFFKIKLGLDSMNIFMESLDNPHRQFPSVHIGGTNGKGSVGSTLLSILISLIQLRRILLEYLKKIGFILEENTTMIFQETLKVMS